MKNVSVDLARFVTVDLSKCRKLSDMNDLLFFRKRNEVVEKLEKLKSAVD